ncbi:MAG: VOC family protein, partial [Planctomycetes bacterium]|nr:VOC family protein [Planctomycetota bacterium]
FLQTTFDAKLTERVEHEGRIRHAEVRIGDSVVMLGRAPDESAARPGVLYVYVEDCEAIYRRAIEAGAVSLREPTLMDYGDRSSGVCDRCGNQWWISTRVETLTPEEIQRRARES